MQKQRSANTDMNENSTTSRIASKAAVFMRKFQFALSVGIISPRCQCVLGHVVRASLSYRGSLRKQKFVSGVKTQGG